MARRGDEIDQPADRPDGRDRKAQRFLLRDFQRVNAQDAEDLKQAVVRRTAPDVTRTAHRIKGSCRMIGATALAGICGELEKRGAASDWGAIERELAGFKRECTSVDAHIDAF